MGSVLTPLTLHLLQQIRTLVSCRKGYIFSSNQLRFRNLETLECLKHAKKRELALILLKFETFLTLNAEKLVLRTIKKRF